MPLTQPDPNDIHDLFVHIRLLIGVILGLSIGRLLQGIANIIEHPRAKKLWWVHLGWVAWAIFFVISFWWWEFHLSQIGNWTIWKYFFLFGYSGLYFLVCAILFPSSLEGYDGYQDYLISRRRWFFGFIAAITVFDLGDGLLKGADYLTALGPRYAFHIAWLLVLAIAGALTRRPAAHAAILILALIELLGWSFHAYDRLF